MRKRSKTVKLALIAILFSIFGVLNVNAASNANYEMQLQKVNGLGITTKPSESIDSVQSMAITRNHFVFVMANSKDDNAKNIFYVMSKNEPHSFVRQIEIESCGHGNGIAYNENDNVLVVADGAHKKLIVYNADNFTKIKEVSTGSEVYHNITYDKDHGMYYLSQNGKNYITRYSRELVKLTNLLVESYNVDGGKNYRINQDIGYSNNYIYLTNYVSADKMTSAYSANGYKASTYDAIIYTYNVVTGEKSKMFYNKAASNATLENWKELEGIDFINDKPYLMFQRGGTFQVYTTDSIKKAMAIPDDGKNYKETCTYEKVKNKYLVDIKYDTNANKKANGNLKLFLEDKNRELVIIGYSEGVYTKDGSYDRISNLNEASSLKDPNIIGKRVTYESTYLSVNADEAHKGKVLEIIMAVGKTDNDCMSYSTYQFSNNKNKATLDNFTVYIEILDLTQNKPKEVENPHYNGVCRVIREGFNYQNKYGELTNIYDAEAAKPNGNYQQLFPYCFEPKTMNVYDKEDNVARAIKYVMEAYNVSKMKSEDVAKLESNAFLTAFFKSKARAEEQNHAYNASNTAQAANANPTLSCNYKSIREKKESGEYVYDPLNTKSYFGVDVKDVTVQYTYNYDSNHSKTTDPTKVCSKTCYEAVDVEYGAPEAAVAGFAIQYQVKITSRVRCEAKIDIEAPTPPTICQPQPSCVHKSGKELTQGGPNEQFDACIQKCDGGKYSQKCSQACYNEVYNTNSTTKKTNTLNIGTVKQMKNQHIPLDQLSNGYYDRDADGNITWNAYNADEDAEYAKWYLDHNELKAGEDVRNNGKYFHFDEGFKKSSNWTFIDLCGANCTHINCAADTYLDQRRIEADYVENLKRYNAAVTDCQAAAVCSTKSSYYSMEADVEQIGKKGVQTITYPSQAKNNEKNRSCLKSLSKSDMVQATNGADSVITCYDGCYKSTAQRNNYLSEITFPGTWVNNKSGEISYSTKKREDGWHFVDGKFFTPLNAKAVNADYWRYYVALQSSTVSTKSINQEVVRNECRDYTTYEMTEENKVTTKNNGPEKYNIRANITDFGYFGWDFNVQCFYAIAEYETNTISSKDKNSTPLKCYPEPKPECTGDKCKSQEPYEIRTVAKEDLFPSSEKGGQATADTSKPGRITGFNWSDGAEIISKVQANEQGQPVVINRNYVNNPLKVLGDIQSRGVDIYGDGDSDDKTPGNNPYLDYSFYLTPKALKEIRDFGKDDAGSNYTDFTGEFKIIGGVNAYYSSLIERLNGINAVKKVGAPGCNNDNERERVCVGIDANRFGSK